MQTPPPNIVIIMADEIRQDVVLHTYPVNVPLPNLDRLRREGVTLANCFCQTPTCCPSRGSFVTGKYPHQLGLWNHGCVLPPEERTLGHHFAAHGYDAVAIGKTHGMCPGFRSITSWKLVYHTTDRSELYHLAVDPGERVNRFGRPECHEVERDLLLKMVQVLGTCRREGFNQGKNGYFG